MERNLENVKSKRRYNSTGRLEQARQNRDAILRAAERQLGERGYASATVAAIAAEAGVSVETVYKAFGGKAGVVRALYERDLAGAGSVPAYERSDAMRERESHPRTVMREWGFLTAEVASLVTPIRLLMRAAAVTDQEMASLLADIEDERLKRMRHHARYLKDRGYLREGVSVGEATDILWVCSSAELYELLVLKRGWSLPRFAQYVTHYMTASLLPEMTQEGPAETAPA
ncbi:TetR/AcrR family transcriptional regulator [Arthrobacter sp. ISL-48]|uniref:TetR/AcrR family transcriptional regulator n=1 Tax=Arthrobacter sp. ISL-48 TaxID=2819110 RepID=UPI001BE992CA|nr:TetR/AcrR family transcriptional regulator [Arthrobacter sp. ISL-48]MBT2532918.1 TetR/AcrR family transcriptional regulator [Arthrobacter sp. ISL-48]